MLTVPGTISSLWSSRIPNAIVKSTRLTQMGRVKQLATVGRVESFEQHRAARQWICTTCRLKPSQRLSIGTRSADMQPAVTPDVHIHLREDGLL